MSSSDQTNGARLSSWRSCALYAQQIIAHAGLELPHVTYLNGAITALMAAEQGPRQAQSGLSIFSFGSNDRGALGQGGAQSTSQWEPAREVTVPAGLKVVGVAAASSNTALVTADGQLLLAGTNKAYLHADRDAGGRTVPTAIAALAGQQVTRVFMSSQSSHIFACVDGRLMGWGANAKALGLDKRSVTLAPAPVEGLADQVFSGGVPCDQIRAMALGLNHTLLITAAGEVFSSGLNSRGQLGIGALRNPFETFSFGRTEASTGTPPAVAAACGSLHSAFVTADGGLYVFGQNQHGQLGLASADDQFRPTRVSSGSIAGKRVVAVTCTNETTLCITEDGQLHGAGSNGNGALGLGELAAVAEFTAIQLPSAARQLSAGEHHVLVCMADGRVYAWGNNSFGQVTPGDKSRAVMTPTELTFFAGKRAIEVIAGKAHSLVITETG